jgi:nitrogen regulatory protein PII
VIDVEMIPTPGLPTHICRRFVNPTAYTAGVAGVRTGGRAAVVARGTVQPSKIGVRGQEYNVDLLPKIKIEIVIPSERCEEVIKTLVGSARTGKIGDGKIFIYGFAEAVRIRNDDRGALAL